MSDTLDHAQKPPLVRPPSLLERGRVASRARRGMVLMVLLSTAASIVNYASSLVFSRLLEPVGFGELTSLLAFSVVLAVPLGAASTVVAERVAVAHSAGDLNRVRTLVRYALGHLLVLALMFGALYVLCLPLVMDGLDIREPGPALAVAPLVMLFFLNPVTVGVLQGMERFGALGLLLFVTAFSRLLFGVPWTVLGGGAGGAIAGQALGLAVVSVVVLWRYRSWMLPRGSGIARSGMKRRLDLHAVSAAGAFTAFALLSNVDLVLARSLLNQESAGIYAAIATVSKVFIFLPSAIAVIMVPSAARDHAATGSGLGVLQRSAALIGGAVLVLAIPAIAAPDQTVQIMFGDGYDAASEGVLPAVLAGSGLALLYLLASYSVAIRDRRWVFLLVGGLALQVTVLAFVHGSATQLAWAQAGVVWAILLANESLFRALLRRSPA